MDEWMNGERTLNGMQGYVGITSGFWTKSRDKTGSDTIVVTQNFLINEWTLWGIPLLHKTDKKVERFMLNVGINRSIEWETRISPPLPFL